MKLKIKRFLFGGTIMIIILTVIVLVLLLIIALFLFGEMLWKSFGISLAWIGVGLLVGSFFIHFSNRIGKDFYRRYKVLNKQTLVLWIDNEPLPRPPITHLTNPYGRFRPLEWNDIPDGGVEVNDTWEPIK